MIPADTKPGTIVWGYDWGSAWQAPIVAINKQAAVLVGGEKGFMVCLLEKLFLDAAAYRAMANEASAAAARAMESWKQHIDAAARADEEAAKVPKEPPCPI